LAISLSIVIPKPVLDAAPAMPTDEAGDAGLAALTARMARGEEEAFREFHGAWFHRLFRYVLVLMRGDEHAACDVAQETLLRVVRRIRCFESEVVFWDWLTCLARSAAADHGRKTGRYRRLLDWIANRPEPMVDAPANDALESALTSALEGMPETERALLVAKYTDRRAVRDIAREAGLTEEAVESRLSRARAVLRRMTLKLLRHETET
jgi:RNA polymerase sigma-70 factor (ECF subfamily)